MVGLLAPPVLVSPQLTSDCRPTSDTRSALRLLQLASVSGLGCLTSRSWPSSRPILSFAHRPLPMHCQPTFYLHRPPLQCKPTPLIEPVQASLGFGSPFLFSRLSGPPSVSDYSPIAWEHAERPKDSLSFFFLFLKKTPFRSLSFFLTCCLWQRNNVPLEMRSQSRISMK